MLFCGHVVLLRHLLLEAGLLILLGLVLSSCWRLVEVYLGSLALLIDRRDLWLAGDGKVVYVTNFVSIFNCGAFFSVCAADADLRLE